MGGNNWPLRGTKGTLFEENDNSLMTDNLTIKQWVYNLFKLGWVVVTTRLFFKGRIMNLGGKKLFLYHILHILKGFHGQFCLCPSWTTAEQVNSLLFYTVVLRSVLSCPSAGRDPRRGFPPLSSPGAAGRTEEQQPDARRGLAPHLHGCHRRGSI